VHINLYLTDDTELRAYGFVTDGGLFAEVHWNFPIADSHLGEGTLWGTPEAMRRLAALAVPAAIPAEEEACWQARQATTAAAGPGSWVA
jgi:hypothetical protein